MSKHTWKAVTIALTLTATVVIAKSLISTPEEVAAVPGTQDQVTTELQIEQPHAQATPLPVKSAPVISKSERKPLPEKKRISRSWTVAVVRGDQIEFITYQDPYAQVVVPGVND